MKEQTYTFRLYYHTFADKTVKAVNEDTALQIARDLVVDGELEANMEYDHSELLDTEEHIYEDYQEKDIS